MKHHQTFLCAVLFWQVTLAAFPFVYFSPADNIRKKLLALIKQEKESIKIAAYFITDKTIVDELGKAKSRGVAIEVVVDKLSLENGWGKVTLLQSYGIPVYVYDGGTQSIMHNKFFIFGKNEGGKKLWWTGSYNPTQKADRANRENVLVGEDDAIAQQYEREFERLKKICRRFSERDYAPSEFSPSMSERLQFRWPGWN